MFCCRYKKLKKLLKACKNEEGVVDEQAEDAFFQELQDELRYVNHIFHEQADKMVAKYQRNTRGILAWLLSPLLGGEKFSSKLAEKAYWCRKYARANAVALRKILKKHDKTCENRRGREFLQKCWRTTSSQGVGLFLHSPLLDELKAIQEKLQMSLREEGFADPNADSKSVYPMHPEEDGNASDHATDVSMTAHRLHKVASHFEPSEHNSAGPSTGQEPLTAGMEVSKEGSASFIFPPKSETTPSLKRLREMALKAIEESPTCLLDSSDIEWEEDSPSQSIDVRPQNWPVLHNGKFEQPKVEEDKDDKRKNCGRRGIDPEAPVAPKSKGSGRAASSGKSSGVGPAQGPFRDDELRCPICLEIMYKPVGLGCGHKFCKSCALEAAGFGKVVGAFRNIITYIPARVSCPQCRQKQVYKGAVSLKELSSLIKDRYPKEWASRRQVEKARKMDQGISIIDSPRTNNPWDLIRSHSSIEFQTGATAR
jgi:hypothetical protein